MEPSGKIRSLLLTALKQRPLQQALARFPRKRSIPTGRPFAGSHRSHFRHYRGGKKKNPTFGRKRLPSGACLRSRRVIAGAHVPEMAADPLPPSAMAQPGTLNLNNEVSAGAEIVGCGAPSRCLLPRGQWWGAGLPKGGARPARTHRGLGMGSTRRSGPRTQAPHTSVCAIVGGHSVFSHF